jgi:hypothetical protein
MELDNLALESVMDARRKAVQTSIRQIGTEELNSLVTEILCEDRTPMVRDFPPVH